MTDRPTRPPPGHMFERLERQMDDLWTLMRRASPAPYRRAWTPRVDVYETTDQFVAIVELAGIDPGDVTIEVEGPEVVISGERRPPSADGCVGGELLQLEIPFGPFERHLVLPAAVDAGSATASFDDGFLTVRLPKRPPGPKRVRVDVE